MSKKKLNADIVLSELSGQSVYFKKPSALEKSGSLKESKKSEPDSPKTRLSAAIGVNKTGGKEPIDHDAMVSRYPIATIETIRKAVKVAGKKSATHRFSVGEKRPLEDLVFAYTRRSIHTSKNEVIRIALNFILVDHQETGENSILNLVLKSLHE